MHLRMCPTSLHALLCAPHDDIGFLWPHEGRWRLYRISRQWRDGIIAASCHPQHPHQIFLNAQQWVVYMRTEKPAEWLALLGPTWESAKIEIELQGRSMRPTIPTPARIQLAPIHTRALRPGQVIVWGQPGTNEGHRWIAHRIVEIPDTVAQKSPHIITRGDNNAHLDTPLTHFQLLGHVVGATYQGQSLFPNSKRARLWASHHRCRMWWHRRLHPFIRH